MENYETLVEAMRSLKTQGYTHNLQLKEHAITDHDDHIELKKEDFVVDKFFRFEGMTNPSDQTILYAISSPTRNIKGLLVQPYGAYADDIPEDIAEKLQAYHR
jgi:hypothetical protein